MLTFPERLARALRYSGLSASQLDARMTWRRGWTKGLLSGRIDKPPYTVVVLLATYLRVSVGWLWCGKIDDVAQSRLQDAQARLDASRVSEADRKALVELLEML